MKKLGGPPARNFGPKRGGNFLGIGNSHLRNEPARWIENLSPPPPPPPSLKVSTLLFFLLLVSTLIPALMLLHAGERDARSSIAGMRGNVCFERGDDDDDDDDARERERCGDFLFILGCGRIDNAFLGRISKPWSPKSGYWNFFFFFLIFTGSFITRAVLINFLKCRYKSLRYE